MSAAGLIWLPVRRIGAAVPAALLGFLLLSSCGDAGTGDVQGVVPEAPPEQEIVTEAFGLVKALTVRSIYVDLPAEVTEVHVTGAESVTRGDVLVTLDLEEYETLLAARESTLAIERLALSRLEQNLERDSVAFSSEYQSTRNQLAAREAELADLEREHAEKGAAAASGDDPDLRSLRLDVEGAHADARQAREEHVREVRMGVLAAHQIEQLRLTVDSRERRVRSLELSIESWRTARAEELAELATQITTKSTEIANLRLALDAMATPQTVGIEMQRKTVARLESDLAALRRDAERPFLDGSRVVVDLERAIVTDLSVHRGDPVGPGRLLLRLVDLGSLIVEADVPEEFIRDVRVGAPVTIVPLADPDQESYGTVRQIAGMAVNRSGETIVPVQVSIDDDRGYLLPNFNVDVAIGYVGSGSK
ncbi:MAG: HlyD family efflux transporter periplasmic adaptor subunit [Spirochaetaceae bacterium]|nr:HlyD family efflux transporter periplasmic adaptor subunit [Spirochaetaceae bacterium]